MSLPLRDEHVKQLMLPSARETRENLQKTFEEESLCLRTCWYDNQDQPQGSHQGRRCCCCRVAAVGLGRTHALSDVGGERELLEGKNTERDDDAGR